MKYVALLANVLIIVWWLAMLVAMGLVGKRNSVLDVVLSPIAFIGLPVAFISFAVAGLYYGVHILRNKKLTMISRLFWLMSPVLCFFPYIYYWIKYVRDE